jgi:hypothetical protein
MAPASPASCGWINPAHCARLLALGGQLLAILLGVASCLVQLQGDDGPGWGTACQVSRPLSTTAALFWDSLLASAVAG